MPKLEPRAAWFVLASMLVMPAPAGFAALADLPAQTHDKVLRPGVSAAAAAVAEVADTRIPAAVKGLTGLGQSLKNAAAGFRSLRVPEVASDLDALAAAVAGDKAIPGRMRQAAAQLSAKTTGPKDCLAGLKSAAWIPKDIQAASACHQAAIVGLTPLAAWDKELRDLWLAADKISRARLPELRRRARDRSLASADRARYAMAAARLQAALDSKGGAKDALRKIWSDIQALPAQGGFTFRRPAGGLKALATGLVKAASSARDACTQASNKLHPRALDMAGARALLANAGRELSGAASLWKGIEARASADLGGLPFFPGASQRTLAIPELLKQAAELGKEQLAPDSACPVKSASDTSCKFNPTITIEGTREFQLKVAKDLQIIAATESGRELLASINGSGQDLRIHSDEGGGNWAWTDPPPTGKNRAGYLNSDGTPGTAANAEIGYNPDRTSLGAAPLSPDGAAAWFQEPNRPPQVGLVHEMVHADDFMHGRLDSSDGVNTGDKAGEPVSKSELRAVGLTDEFSGLDYSENTYRADQDLPARTYY